MFLAGLAIGLLACFHLFELLEVQAQGDSLVSLVSFVMVKFALCLCLAAPFVIGLGLVKDRVKALASCFFWQIDWFVVIVQPHRQIPASCPRAFFRPPRLFS